MSNLTPYEPPVTAIRTYSNPPSGGEPERPGIDYLRIARRRWLVIPIFTIMFALLAFIVSILQPKTYESQGEVLVQSAANAVSSSVSSSQASAIANIIGIASNGDLPTTIERMTSDQAMTQVALMNNLAVKPLDLKHSFDIEPDKTSSTIIQVTAFAPKPKLAVALVKSIVEVYNAKMSQESSTVVGRMANATRTELNSVGVKLEQAEIAKAAYAKSTGLIDPLASSSAVQGQIFTLQNDLIDAEKSTAVAHSQYDFYAKQMKILDPSIMPNLSFTSNPRIDSDKAQLETLEQQRAQLAQQYTPSDDQMLANQRQIDTVKQQMDDERRQESRTFSFQLGTPSKHITAPSSSYVVSSGTQELNPLREDARQKMSDAQATLDASTVQIKALKSAIDQYQSAAQTSPDTVRKAGDLTANVEVLRSIYGDLQAQSAQLQARLPAEQDVATFLSYPIIPLHQKSPRPLLYSAIAGLFGFLIGCIVAVLIDNGDLRVRDDKDAETLFGQPVLQTIPWNKQLQGTGKSLAQSDEYHELACTLGYLGVGRTIRTILVTSAVKDEGTTTVASNLALALADEGRRVVIVDANLRKPVLHSVFGQENSVGLAGLMRNGTKPDEALVNVDGSTSLSIIPGGTSEGGAGWSDMLNTDKFDEVLANLLEKADIILIDAPAVFAGFETSVLADKVDGIIFVSRPSFAPRNVVRRAFELLSNCSAPIIGTVMNGANGPSVK